MSGKLELSCIKVYGEQDKTVKNRTKCPVVGSTFPYPWLQLNIHLRNILCDWCDSLFTCVKISSWPTMCSSVVANCGDILIGSNGVVWRPLSCGSFCVRTDDVWRGRGGGCDGWGGGGGFEGWVGACVGWRGSCGEWKSWGPTLTIVGLDCKWSLGAFRGSSCEVNRWS